MSTTTTTSLAPLSSSCTGVYNTPNQDNVCAMIYKGNATDIMSKCCGDAQLVAYQNNCGVYCVAIDQTTAELSDCLYAHGAPDANVFCSGNDTATTKTEDAKVPASAQASVINPDDDDKDDDDETASITGTSTETSSSSSASETSSETGNAAAGVAPKSTFNTVGLAIGALLFSSIAAGAFQL